MFQENLKVNRIKETIKETIKDIIKDLPIRDTIRDKIRDNIINNKLLIIKDNIIKVSLRHNITRLPIRDTVNLLARGTINPPTRDIIKDTIKVMAAEVMEAAIMAVLILWDKLEGCFRRLLEVRLAGNTLGLMEVVSLVNTTTWEVCSPAPSLVSSAVKLTTNRITKDTEIKEIKEIREIKGIVVLMINQVDGILDKYLNSNSNSKDKDRVRVSIREIHPLEIHMVHKVLHRNNTALLIQLRIMDNSSTILQHKVH